MTSESHAALLEELIQRLKALDCLALSTKVQIVGAAHAMSASGLRHYLGLTLAFVEREIASITYAPFRKTCRALAATADLRKQFDFLGIDDPDGNSGLLKNVANESGLRIFQLDSCDIGRWDDSSWLTAACKNEMDKPLSLVCLANHYAQHRKPNANFDTLALAVLASALEFCGLVADGVRVLEAHLGLRPADYAAPDLAARLTHAFVKNETNVAVKFVITLASELAFVGRTSNSLRLLEAHLCLSSADYAAPDLRMRLARLFAKRKILAINAIDYVRNLAHALGFIGRNSDGVRLLEAHLSLCPADYAVPDLAAVLAHAFAQHRVEANNAANFVVELAEALGFVGRQLDGVRLLEAHLCLSPADYAADNLAPRLAGVFGKRQLAADNVMRFVHLLAVKLQFIDRRLDGVRLLEALLSLISSDNAGSGLATRLAHLFAERQLEANDALSFFRSLADAISVAGEFSAPDCSFVRNVADALLLVGRESDGVRLLEVLLKLSSADYTAPDLASRLAGTFAERQLSANNAVCLAIKLADALRFVGRESDGVHLLEAYLGLSSADYTAPDLASRLAGAFAERQLPADNAMSLLRALADVLRLVGRVSDEVRLLEAMMDRFDWLDSDEGPTAENTVQVAGAWLMNCGRTHQLRASRLCERLLPLLRRSLSRENMSFADRKRFASELQIIRPLIVDVLLYWAGREPDLVQAARLRQQAAFADIELNHRVLFERVYVGEMEIDAGSDGASLPCPAWPFAKSRRALWRPRWRGHLPEGDDGPVDPACNALALAAFDAIDTSEPHKQATTAPPTTVFGERPKWVAELKMLVVHGVDDQWLSEQLGVGTVFLRAMFTLDGTLRWTALHSDGRQLESLANNLAAPASPQDQTRLRWAVALHDLDVSLTYLVDTAPLAIVGTTDVGSLRQWAAQQLAPVVKHARNLQADLEADESNAPALRDEWLRLLKEAAEAAWQTRGDQPPSGGAAIPPLHWLASLLDTGFGPLMIPPFDADDLPAWKQMALEGWRAAVELLRSVKQQPAAAEQLPDQLDQATQRFLGRVSKVWNLDPLATALARLAKLPDLVVQVDDVLHGVPVPHLLANGRPLWMQVDSVRVTLSVMLDAFQQQLDERGRADEAENRRMLSVSWFGPHDPAAPGAYRLHHGQQRLAEQYGMEWFAAADDPQAARRTWLNGLALGGYRVATLLGHGSLRHSAVHLADVPWTGGGHDLNRVEFLIVPSCSIGRVQHTGERDVEGFCVALTIHQARGVLACKWKVNAAEAPLFANEVAAQYLKLREQQSPADPGVHLRARAFNLARHTLLNGNARRRPDWPGLNTAAAFELYGRG